MTNCGNLFRRHEMADGHVRYEPVGDEIDRLTRALAEARAEADRLRAYHETWQRTVPSWEAENARLRAALAEVINRDQRECQRVVEIDPAGNTYAVTKVDGPLAMIARRVLEQERSR